MSSDNESRQKHQQLVYAEQVKALYENIRAALLPNVVVVSLVAYVLWDAAPRTAIAWCWSSVVLLMAAMVALGIRYRAAGGDASQARKWGVRFLMASATAGVLWGAIGVLLYVPANFPCQVFLIFVIGGLAAGAATTLSGWLPTYYVYLFPSVLPFAIRLLMEGGELRLSMAAMLAIFIGAMATLARNGARRLEEALWLRFENLGLIERLSDAKHELRQVNENLEQRISLRTEELEKAGRAREDMEKELSQARKMEAIGTLAGGVAHDFNNILTGILSYAQLLAKEPGNERQVREDARQILEAANRARMLTGQLLAFGRKQIIQPKVLSLNTLISEAENMLRRVLPEDIDLTTILAPDLYHISADPAQVQQVIINLAVNARDAMRNGGRLIIETDNAYLDGKRTCKAEKVEIGPYARLSVRDNGIGMDAETLERIFEPFFTTKELGKGTGLGLSMVYGIVRQSSGYIWADSNPGRGTTFDLYFPRVEHGLEHQVVARSEPPPSMTAGPETVLIVEDDPTVRRAICRTLKHAGYEILEARDGTEAVRIADEHSGAIHLLLTDVVMPSISGPEVAAFLGQQRPQLRVLYMSGYVDDAIAERGVVQEGAAFIQKPFMPKALIKKIREVMDNG